MRNVRHSERFRRRWEMRHQHGRVAHRRVLIPRRPGLPSPACSDSPGREGGRAGPCRGMGGTESSLESVQKVLSLGTDDRLTTFADMWYWVFLWALFSSFFVHGVAALIAFLLLRRHRTGRFVPVVIIVMGFLGPILGGTITSVAFAGVYQAAGKTMAPLEALVFGMGQTVLTIIVSYSRILATL